GLLPRVSPGVSPQVCSAAETFPAGGTSVLLLASGTNSLHHFTVAFSTIFHTVPCLPSATLLYIAMYATTEPSPIYYQGYLPVCDLICLFKLDTLKYSFPQVLQEYGFSPVFPACCASIRRKSFPHILQEYGLSPVWILTCVFNTDFPHVSQECGLSPLWLLMWIIKLQ
uniref:Uncharacterized protein n=1 Tax=Seriola lalandi dorsalis TaxID=1841481 RepID=A0A3B4YEA2_SERLL